MGKSLLEHAVEAVREADEAKGISYKAIAKYLEENADYDESQADDLKDLLKKGLLDGTFDKVKGVGLIGSFKIGNGQPSKKAGKKALTDAGEPSSPKAAKKPPAKKKTAKKAATKPVEEDEDQSDQSEPEQHSDEEESGGEPTPKPAKKAAAKGKKK